MKLAKTAATALILAIALPTCANAASYHRYYHGYHSGGNTAAAAHFQDQFKNTYSFSSVRLLTPPALRLAGFSLGTFCRFRRRHFELREPS